MRAALIKYCALSSTTTSDYESAGFEFILLLLTLETCQFSESYPDEIGALSWNSRRSMIPTNQTIATTYKNSATLKFSR